MRKTHSFLFFHSDECYSLLKADNVISTSNTYEVIELDQSDDEGEEFLPNVSAFLAPAHNIMQNEECLSDQYDKPDNSVDSYNKKKNHMNEQGLQQNFQTTSTSLNDSISPTNSRGSSRSSPLLTPLSAITKIDSETKSMNGKSEFSEVTIQPISSASIFKRQFNLSPKDQALSNFPKSKAIPRSTQINNDPIELYCLSLADCLKAMPRSERERVKYEFAKILKDAHYKDQF